MTAANRYKKAPVVNECFCWLFWEQMQAHLFHRLRWKKRRIFCDRFVLINLWRHHWRSFFMVHRDVASEVIRLSANYRCNGKRQAFLVNWIFAKLWPQDCQNTKRWYFCTEPNWDLPEWNWIGRICSKSEGWKLDGGGGYSFRKVLRGGMMQSMKRRIKNQTWNANASNAFACSQNDASLLEKNRFCEFLICKDLSSFFSSGLTEQFSEKGKQFTLMSKHEIFL